MKSYQETVHWLFQQLPMYQQVGNKAYKVDLNNIQLLSNYLGNPQDTFKTIHVAGTNGKGSVSHMLASVLQEAGYKVGLYTSPHLRDFRERIKINGIEISEQLVTDFVAKHQAFFEEHELSFFEMTVGLAFDYFSIERVDIAVIEVGLGGRLDSTNIIIPELSVITNIGLDHTQILGDSLAEIAAEKAGIIKRGVPVVIGESLPETLPVFDAIAASQSAPLYLAEEYSGKVFSSDLKGYYQQKNLRTVASCFEILNKNGWDISESTIEKALAEVVSNTGLRGRWEVLQEHPKVICDTAHNKDGLLYAMRQLQDENFEQMHLVFGVVNDKDLSSVLPLLPKNANYYFCRPNIPRGMDADQLKAKATDFGLSGESYSSVAEAYETALNSAGEADGIYIGGSTFTVAEII